MPTQDRKIWGPSVSHSYYCAIKEDPPLRCNCPKSFYCAGCDDQHFRRTGCPRTILDDIVEQVTFKERPLKRLINEILDSAEARGYAYGKPYDHHIAARVNELADKYGNLGMTRKRLVRLAWKELKKRYGRQRKAFRAAQKRARSSQP